MLFHVTFPRACLGYAGWLDINGHTREKNQRPSDLRISRFNQIKQICKLQDFSEPLICWCTLQILKKEAKCSAFPKLL